MPTRCRRGAEQTCRANVPSKRVEHARRASGAEQAATTQCRRGGGLRRMHERDPNHQTRCRRSASRANPTPIPTWSRRPELESAPSGPRVCGIRMNRPGECGCPSRSCVPRRSDLPDARFDLRDARYGPGASESILRRRDRCISRRSQPRTHRAKSRSCVTRTPKATRRPRRPARRRTTRHTHTQGDAAHAGPNPAFGHIMAA